MTNGDRLDIPTDRLLMPAEIRERFGVSLTRYYQQLAALLARPEALAHSPALVRRLQRLTDARRRQRSVRERVQAGE